MISNLSRLTLGTVQFGLRYGVANQHGQPEYRDVLEILRLAHEGGINCLDTAAGYGDSEEILGRALADLNLASAMTVVTKTAQVPPGVGNRDARQLIRETLQRSLQRLRLERIPICLIHREEDFVHIEALLQLQQEGLIGEIGLSVMTPAATSAALDSGLIRAVQIPANLLDHRFRKAGIYERTAQQNCRLFVRSIYLQGLLLMPDDSVPRALNEVLPVRTTLRVLAAEAGLTLEQLAMGYILGIPEVTSVLIGVDTPDQMRQNLATFNQGPLSPDLMHAIDEIVPNLPDTILLPTLWPR